MNFLDIAKTVRSLAGIQGTGPTSVVDAQGIEAVIVQFVKDANVDIQSLREDFEFMEATQTFLTVPGQSTYTRATIFNSADPPLKTYKHGSFCITDLSGQKHWLREYEYYETLEHRYLNDTQRSLPKEVGINAQRSVVVKQTPDNNYTVQFKYYRNPQILSVNSDVPWIPSAFHNLLVYKALEKVAVYLSQPEIYRGYSVETARLAAGLMRISVPKKRLQARPIV